MRGDGADGVGRDIQGEVDRALSRSGSGEPSGALSADEVRLLWQFCAYLRQEGLAICAHVGGDHWAPVRASGAALVGAFGAWRMAPRQQAGPDDG